jgi:hypothetical protein
LCREVGVDRVGGSGTSSCCTGEIMRKQPKKIVLSRETLRQLDNVQLSGLVGGADLIEDTNDRRCEPSIVSCHPGC